MDLQDGVSAEELRPERKRYFRRSRAILCEKRLLASANRRQSQSRDYRKSPQSTSILSQKSMIAHGFAKDPPYPEMWPLMAKALR
jgi:hypothetical protein